MHAKRLVLALASAALVAAVPVSMHARAGEFGACADPTIKFAAGLDGRTEASFAPNDAAEFSHGSALNIGVIASFICGQLQSSCKADAAGIAACAAGQTAAALQTGQAAADAFNAAVTGGAAAARVKRAGGNVQTFTGALGGAPPAVVPGGKGFVVDGSEFINEAGALGRSCDVQHNTCANAANSGSAAFAVADCETQNAACHAAISV